jgi:hypothetical protein
MPSYKFGPRKLSAVTPIAELTLLAAANFSVLK